MKRRTAVRAQQNAMAAWLQLSELVALTPFVAATRLQKISTMSSDAAVREWSSWGIEKAFVWQRAALRAWNAAISGAQPGAATAARVLQPVRARVKRNARKRA